MKILFVGGSGGTHVASSLYRAAKKIDIVTELLDIHKATNNRLVRAIYWRLMDKKPPNITVINSELLLAVDRFMPDIVLTTGNSPIEHGTLIKIGEQGIKVINFSTDDPFNGHHKSQWFLESLLAYDVVFTPRRANLKELETLTQKNVHYLPFGYDESLFYPNDTIVKKNFLLFVGTGDRDRRPLLRSIVDKSIPLMLMGSYWGSDPILSPFSEGQADPEQVRIATCEAQFVLCLVRRANRDGHVMRSFEIPACGAPMLVEHTREHEAIFGSDGDCVRFFYKDSELASIADEMWNDKAATRRLGVNMRNKFCREKHSYTDRLQEMIRLI